MAHLYRRALLARLLKLPPPRNAVGAERDIPVPMSDGVRMAIAEQTVYHDEAHPSSLILPVVTGE